MTEDEKIAEAVQRERQRCAKIAEGYGDAYEGKDYSMALIAYSIRNVILSGLDGP